jgi:hypothetical protein
LESYFKLTKRVISLPKPKIIGYNWPLSSQYIVNFRIFTKRSDMKEIARPEKWKWNFKNSIWGRCRKIVVKKSVFNGFSLKLMILVYEKILKAMIFLKPTIIVAITWIILFTYFHRWLNKPLKPMITNDFFRCFTSLELMMMDR